MPFIARARLRAERERDPPHGGPARSAGHAALLAAVTDAMVGFPERYYHRPSGSAKSQLSGGDLVACVLGNVYTDVEKTLIELQRAPVVTDNNAFQRAMADRLVAIVEELTRRQVLHFISPPRQSGRSS